MSWDLVNQVTNEHHVVIVATRDFAFGSGIVSDACFPADAMLIAVHPLTSFKRDGASAEFARLRSSDAPVAARLVFAQASLGIAQTVVVHYLPPPMLARQGRARS